MSETPATAATAAPAPAAPPAQPAQPAAPAAWHAGLDSDALGWVQNRGLDKLDAGAAALASIKQARELEKLRGVPADRLLTLPQDLNAKGALDAIYNRLGRPEKAEGYQFKFTAEMAAEEKSIADALAPGFHAAGLTQAQAAEIFNGFRDFANKAAAEAQAAEEAANAAGVQKLKDEWKDTFDLNLAIARATASKLGLDEETVAALEKSMGNAGVVKMLQKIGAKSGEGNFVSGNAPQSFGVTTPEAAQERINSLRRDADFTRKYLSGDPEATKVMRDLTRVAAGGKPA